MKKITILGSTGSIGLSSLSVIKSDPERYQVIGLAAGRNIELLDQQIDEFLPPVVALFDESKASLLKKQRQGRFCPEIYSGPEGMIHLATLGDIDTVISAISGAAALLPTYAAIKSGKQIALANKETMVMAGPLIMAEAKKRNISILPVDSEHSAIFQSLHGHPKEDLKRVILTASGGPFRSFSPEEIEKVTPKQALNHPSWDMGPKITIDSATLMNKGLEVIEARWLFDLHMDQISILIHPQSIVHSMVEYKNGSIIAQLGIPNMMTPISYALSYPRHVETPLPGLKLEEVGALTFELPDRKKFKCLDLAHRAGETGDSMPAVMNGANEIAVDAFLKGKINFSDIPSLIEKTMEVHNTLPIESIEQIMEIDRWARQKANELIEEL